jgi:hypothetical protein
MQPGGHIGQLMFFLFQVRFQQYCIGVCSNVERNAAKARSKVPQNSKWFLDSGWGLAVRMSDTVSQLNFEEDITAHSQFPVTPLTLSGSSKQPSPLASIIQLVRAGCINRSLCYSMYRVQRTIL